MATDKKSFILYCDLIHTVNKLPDEKAGLLFKHLLSYVNDENPKTDDLIIEISFEPIKQQLKRDLKDWENKKERLSEAGRKGMEKRWNSENKNITSNKVVKKDITNITVNDTVNVTVNDTVKLNNISDRKLKFSETLKPFLNIYGKDMLNDFFLYWTEPTKSGAKMRYDLQKTWDTSRRLETWSRNNFGNKSDQKQISTGIQSELTLGKESQ